MSGDTVRLVACIVAIVVASVLMLLGEPLPPDSPHVAGVVGYGLLLATVGYLVGRGPA